MVAKKSFNLSRILFIAFHIALPLFNIIVFYIYANGYSFVMAFQRTISGEKVWTMANFSYFFNSITDSSSVLYEALKNTFLWFFIGLFFMVIGIFTSYFIYKKVVGHKFFRVIFFLPGLISAVVISNIVSKMLGVQGFVAKIVQTIAGLEYTPELLADSRYALKALVFKTCIFGIAGNMLIWCGTMSRIPDSIIESAKLEGINWLQELFLIVIPMIMPTVAISLCSSLSAIFGANGGEFLYTKGNYGTMTLSTWMYLQIYRTSTNSNTHNMVAAAGWVITILTVPIVVVARKMINRISEVEY